MSRFKPTPRQAHAAGLPHREDPNTITASGGYLAPRYDPLPRLFAVVEMKPRRERFRCWLRGEPGFTIDVYDRDDIPSPLEALPRFTAPRGFP